MVVLKLGVAAMSVDYQVAHQLHVQCIDQFQYVGDADQFHKPEHWQVPDELKAQLEKGTLYGDCDDFASLAVMLGREKNLPMRFVFCQTENGEFHLVAECDGWIIDNREQDAIQRDLLPYKWISISSYTPGQPWHKVT